MDNSVYDQVESFLSPIYNEPTTVENNNLPLITLTFAQSLDGMISKPGQQILISGKESLAMTHRLRSLHDGIMVGIGTCLVDDPQLNARFVSSVLGKVSQPQPIVIDPYLKLSTECRLVKNCNAGTGKQVYLVASKKGVEQNKEKRFQLENAGVKILVVNTEEDHLPLEQVFQLLKTEGINSLMVEGGSKIIQSCLESNLYNNLIVTIAPIFIGSNGVPAMSISQQCILKLKHVTYQQLGNDIVMSAK